MTLKRIRNILLPLPAVFSGAKEDGIIKANPLDIDLAKLVPIDKRTSDFEPEPYSVAELRAVLANVPEPERWAFQLWAFTGLRTGELIGLRRPRGDLEAKTLKVEETTTERVDKPRMKTPAGRRTIPLLPAALEALQGLRQYSQLAGDRVTVSQGENAALIAKLLGHKTTEMVTRTYVRWVEEGERLGFDRAPRRYGMESLWGQELTHPSHTKPAS